MSLFDVFSQMNDIKPFESVGEEMSGQYLPGTWADVANSSGEWLDHYMAMATRPRFNPNYDGYISPFANMHWGASSDVMQTLAAGANLGPIQEKLDPNRIFTSDIAAFKTLAADQLKVVRIFERRLVESLTEKGKVGLNEDDIEAMQALTSARSAIASINKEQVAIKKNIAELKIKQQQAGTTPGAPVTGGRSMNAFDIGHGMIDNIFKSAIGTTSPPVVDTNYPSADSAQAAAVLDSIVGGDQVASTTQFESENPTTYVVLAPGDSIENARFATYNSSGDVLVDYPNPTAKIVSIDTEGKTANDELMVQYPIKYINE